MNEGYRIIHHLQYAVILTDQKTCRYIIALQDTEDYPLVFLREWYDDPFTSGDYYTLYDNGITSSQTKEIFIQMKAGDTLKAKKLFRKYFRSDEPYCIEVEPDVLDGLISEEWYAVWKEMEIIITNSRHITGYWEVDVNDIITDD